MNNNIYGETCGKEYYEYYGKLGTVPDFLLQYHDSMRYAFYDKYYYYIKTGYLWKSEEGGKNKKILSKVPCSSCVEVFANSTGIYIFDKDIFYIYDLDGNEKEPIRVYYKIESYYICDNRIFMIMYDKESETYYASEIDTETGKINEIYTAGKKNLGTNSWGENSFKNIALKHIMGNKKRVIMWIEFTNYFYPERSYDDYEGIIEAESAGWYSYDLKTKKLKCINHREIYPHQILKGDGEFCRKWYEKSREMKNWFQIAWFDMKKDRMWIQVNHQDKSQVTWEVRSIEGETLRTSERECPVWWADTNMYCGGRHYFDGEYRFCASSDDSKLYAYKSDNTVSLNWNDSRNFSATTDFQICGNCLFFVGPGGDFSSEKGYELAFERPENYVVSWMRNDSLHDSKEEKQIMKSYEMEQKQEENSFLKKTQISIEENFIEKSPILNNEKGSTAPGLGNVYWEEFVKYAFEGNEKSKMSKVGILPSKIADRNWYALRLGTSKVRIELSFNTRKNMIRAGLFFSDIETYNKMVFIKSQIEEKFSNTEETVMWDGKSKTPSVCILKKISNIQEDRTKQYKWYAECAYALVHLVRSII